MKTNLLKVCELTGAALDWAVAKCEGFLCDYQYSGALAHYSTEWAQGGPIIEREGLTVTHQQAQWMAQTDDDLFACGPTPLIAAMRCYVASKLGDNIDIPEELK
jgi:hypothetical protein